MRIAIIGAGAVGSSIGALLKRAKHDVVLVARPEQVEAVRQNGLHIDGCLGTFSVSVDAATRLPFRPDLALLAVKTQDVVNAVEANQDCLADAPVVTLQNGVRSDELVAGLLPKPQIMGAVALVHATYLTPGKVTIGQPGNLLLGRSFGPRDAQVEEVARVLNDACPTQVTDNLPGARWLKLMVNLNNALPAVTNYSMGEVYRDGYLGQLATRLMREGLQIVAAAHIPLASLPDITVTMARLVRRLPLSIATRIAANRAQRMEAQWPLLGSTLQSIRRGRSTEIDYLNGEIVKLGETVGLPTPLNRKIVQLVHRVEANQQYLSVNDLRYEISRSVASAA
ncbi:MAG: 2-dehydropantoate 2-reductase [Anaerolineae bacterium]|nr:2-dehydropantoate 2-reductase [Anaerolineae bacterium]